MCFGWVGDVIMSPKLGKHHTEESRRKMSEALKGRQVWNKGISMSESAKKKLSNKKKGSVGFWAGKKRSEETKEKIRNKKIGTKESEEHKQRISKALTGKPKSPEHCLHIRLAQVGKIISEEQKKKISAANTGRVPSEEARKRMSEAQKRNHKNLNRKRTSLEISKELWANPEFRKKVSAGIKHRYEVDPTFAEKHSVAMKEKYKNPEFYKKFCGENSSRWLGGVSFEPYCPKFNKPFKERVRAWFNYQCVECGTPENGKKLTVHHVTYEKQSCCNDTKPLFIALCNSCNIRANFNREYWEQHFKDIITDYYDGKCYFTEDEYLAFKSEV